MNIAGKIQQGLPPQGQILEKKDKEQCVESVLNGGRKFTQDALQSDDITMPASCAQPDFRIDVKAELGNLETVQEFIIGNEKLSGDLKKKICLAVEEIFVNICSYAYGQEPGNVKIFMKITDQVLVEFRDSGKAFNPLENMVDVDEYDIDTQMGGLGRLIAFELAEQVNYEYINGSNILTLTFYAC